MKSSRQLLLGIGVFLGGGILFFAMMQQGDGPTAVEANTELPKVTETIDIDAKDKPLEPVLTADLETEERILSEKRQERESKIAELDKRAKQFLLEQERAQALAMEKARLENLQYRKDAIEPVINEQVVDQDKITPITKPVVQSRQDTDNTDEENVTAATLTTPVVKPRTVVEDKESKDKTKDNLDTNKTKAPSKSQTYTVKAGEGLIMIANRYNMPVEALSQANKLSKNTTVRVGQKLTIPAASQINGLVNAYNAKSTSKSSAKSDNPAPPTDNRAPSRQLKYTVQSGDGLIKLARQYNVPVKSLAEANNLKTNSILRKGQVLTIPSRLQIKRLEREASERAQTAQRKRSSQSDSTEAQRTIAESEAKGIFGVQVALADNQAKADAVVKKLRAVGYSAKTSQTTKGVRVIVGPKKGKKEALALANKINSDSRTGINNAWVLYWR